MQQQKGFTLIELVMVIVILGILAAFALPRFADLGGDARVSTIKALDGSVRSASSIVHSKALASSPTTGTVTLEGTSISLIDNSYPAPTSTGIQAAAQISPSDFTVDTATADTIKFQSTGAKTPASCEVTYKMATGDSSPTISVVTSGCQ